MSDDPIKRTTKLILFQAQQDNATELVVRSSPVTGPAVRYKVADSWHDWASPSPELAPEILGEIGRLAAFAKRPFPKEGLIDLRFSGVRLLWVARMAGAGECILSPVEQEPMKTEQFRAGDSGFRLAVSPKPGAWSA